MGTLKHMSLWVCICINSVSYCPKVFHMSPIFKPPRSPGAKKKNISDLPVLLFCLLASPQISWSLFFCQLLSNSVPITAGMNVSFLCGVETEHISPKPKVAISLN